MKNRKLGQGMTEYIIIVAIIGISAIAVTRGTSQNLKFAFGKISNALRGVEAATGDAHIVSDSEVTGKNMDNFNNGVRRR